MEVDNNSSDTVAVEKAVNEAMLQDPNEDVKPVVSMAEIPHLVSRLYGLQTTAIKALPGYDDLNFYFRASGTWDNNHITSIHESGFVLKIMNTTQSAQPSFVEAQHQLLKHVHDRGIPTNSVIANKQGKEWSLETFTHILKGSEHTSGPNIVRVLTYIPGKIFVDTPYVPRSFYNIGQFAGRLHNAVKDFHHPFYNTYTTIWNLGETAALTDYVHVIDGEDDARIVRAVLQDFQTRVVPNFKHFQKGIIHGDISEQNLVVSEVSDQDGVPAETRAYDVIGMLDFNEAMLSYTVFDVAVCIAHICKGCTPARQIDVGGHILAGYCRHMSMNDAEMKCLRTLICSRLCQLIVYGLQSYKIQPDNSYLLATAKGGLPALRTLWQTDDATLLARWKTICQSYSTHWNIHNSQ